MHGFLVIGLTLKAEGCNFITNDSERRFACCRMNRAFADTIPRRENDFIIGREIYNELYIRQ